MQRVDWTPVKPELDALRKLYDARRELVRDIDAKILQLENEIVSKVEHRPEDVQEHWNIVAEQMADLSTRDHTETYFDNMSPFGVLEDRDDIAKDCLMEEVYTELDELVTKSEAEGFGKASRDDILRMAKELAEKHGLEVDLVSSETYSVPVFRWPKGA